MKVAKEGGLLLSRCYSSTKTHLPLFSLHQQGYRTACGRRRQDTAGEERTQQRWVLAKGRITECVVVTAHHKRLMVVLSLSRLSSSGYKECSWMQARIRMEQVDDTQDGEYWAKEKKKKGRVAASL